MSHTGTDTAQKSPHPWLMCFPFLALRERCRVGPWDLLPAEDAFSADWASEEFREASRGMLGTFRYGVGHFGLENPTLVARAEGGFTGERPTDEERDALTAAVAFCALDANTPRDRTGQVVGWAVAENVDYWEFPVSVDDNYLSIPTGRRFRVLVCEDRNEDNPIVGPSVLMEVPAGLVKIDADTAEVVHRALSAGTQDARRLLTAIRYFVASWRNQSGVVGLSGLVSDLGEVVVAQQTAFETLLGDDRSRSAWERIVQGVSDLIARFDAGLDLDDPRQEPVVGMCFGRPNRSSYYSDPDPDPDGQFRQWARRFTAVRDKTVHQGDPLKPFEGTPTDRRAQELLETIEEADRVLRDAIRAAAAAA